MRIIRRRQLGGTDQRSVGIVLVDDDLERINWQFNLVSSVQLGIRQGNDLVRISTAGIDDRKLIVIQTFRVVFCLTLVQPHLAFQVHENVREQLADQQKYQTGMQKQNSGLFPTQFKPGDMRCEQVDQEQRPDDVASWKPGNSQIRARRVKKRKKLLK